MPFDFDDHANLAISSVAVAPSPPASGLTLTVAAGQGARFYAAPPFNVTIWPAGQFPDPTNAEVARCTALVGDVLTLERQAEPGGSARMVLVGDLIAETATAKSFIDIENAIGTLDSSVTSLEGDVNTLQTIVATGPVALHAPTHATGGTDPVTITTLAGYPGGTVNFLRADGTFALPAGGGGMPAAHATTHEVGGSDPIDGALSLTTLDVSGNIIAAGSLWVGNGANVAWQGMAYMNTPAVGTITLLDWAGTGFSLLQFGGTTAAFPALKRNGTGLEVWSADNGYYAPFGASQLQAAQGYFWLGIGGQTIRNGTGAPEGVHAHPVGSLFLRTDGGTATTLYVKETGAATSTGWVAHGAGGGGMPAAHATTHNTGGSDPLTALSAAILTSGSLPFARVPISAATRLLGRGSASGAGAMQELTIGTGLTMTGTVLSASGGGAPAAHQATHQIGGSDVLANNAWTNQANTFTQSQTVTGHLFFAGGGSHLIGPNSTDGTDTSHVWLTGGGSNTSDRGAAVHVAGNESSSPGILQLIAGDHVSGCITFTSGSSVERGRIHPSGGFSWGSITDPGAGNLSVAGALTLGAATDTIRRNTVDGADTGSLAICGGGGESNLRGATLYLNGNESAQPGSISLVAGDVSTAAIKFLTQPGYAERGRMHPSGGFSWGSTIDPGAGQIVVGGPVAAGSPYTLLAQGAFHVSTTTTAATNVAFFANPNGFIGFIQTNGSATAYLTSSDARLKTDRGVLISTEVLPRLTIHDFVWQDGTPGRGVFAQEAHPVAPFAVSVGTDERDAEGRLVQPWSVDYSKFVPDLIAGWQQHHAELVALRTELAALKAALGG